MRLLSLSFSNSIKDFPVFYKLLNALRPNRLDAELSEELEFHRSQTAGSLGNITALQDEMRDASTLLWLSTVLQDLRYGIRQLRRAPVLVAAAVLSLALGIGANTAIFTLINAVMFQYLPVHEPGKLVLFNDAIRTGVYSGDAIQADEFSFGFYQYLKTQNTSFEDLCAFRQGSDRVVMHLTGSSDSKTWERARVHLVSGNYFEVLGVGTAAGRLLVPSDDSPAAPPAAVLSFSFWRDRFRLQTSIVGQAVVLNGTAFTIVGVAAPEFFGERIESAPDFWLPLSTQPQVLKRESFLTAKDVFWLNLLGRLKPGVSSASAEANVNLNLHRYYLDQAGSSPSPQARRKIEAAHIRLKPGGGGISGLRILYSRPLHLLMAVTALVLLIACANVAALLLARASARRPEFLARLALGASRNRLLRQVLTENMLLSFISGVFGAGFAWWSVRLLILFLHVNPSVKVRPDLSVLLFGFALCVITGLLFGAIPAIKFSRTDSSLGRGSLRKMWLMSGANALIILQIALSLGLVVGSGLLARSLVALENQNIGFQRNQILVIRTDTSLAGYEPNQFFPLYRDLGERLLRIPRVTSASIARFMPLNGSVSSGNFSLEGHDVPSGVNLTVHDLPVGPHFFETLGIPLLLGRAIDERDTPSAPRVAVVNQSFVRLYLRHENPIGRHMRLGSPFKPPGAEIVGVVGDARFFDLHEQAPPMVFFSLWQVPTPTIEAAVRTTADPLQIAAAARGVFKQVNSRLPIETLTMNSQVEHTLEQQKMITTLCGIFGAVSLLLACVGVYGTFAYSVAGRTHEIGIRMAIGAQQRSVIWLVLRDATVLTLCGLALGLPLALGGTHLLGSLLYHVKWTDPVGIGAAVLLITLTVLMASYLPARRAGRVDPSRALRVE